MKIGEVGLLTNDVIRLANFYRLLLDVTTEDYNEVHQTIIKEETMLTIYNDGSEKLNNNTNICLAFTVDDLKLEYEKVLKLGAKIIQEPTLQPWGAYNMSFYDPDGNILYFRQFKN